LLFTDDEALAIMLGLLAARRLGLVSSASTVEGALAKVERVLPQDVRVRIAAVQQTATFDPVRGVTLPATETVMSVAAAVHDQRRVVFEYASAQGEETERAVDLYGLVHLMGRWYAPGYCHLRRDLRLFRLDRIRQITPQEETFQRPPHFEPLSFVQDALAVAPNAWHVEALLFTTLEEARREIPAHDAALEPSVDGVIFRANVECLNGAARYLAHLGFRFEVRQPAELRTVLHNLASELLAAAHATRDATDPQLASVPG
jgi:predicted DNA-binding transcriptional regulator YafY